MILSCFLNQTSLYLNGIWTIRRPWWLLQMAKSITEITLHLAGVEEFAQEFIWYWIMFVIQIGPNSYIYVSFVSGRGTIVWHVRTPLFKMQSRGSSGSQWKAYTARLEWFPRRWCGCHATSLHSPLYSTPWQHFRYGWQQSITPGNSSLALRIYLYQYSSRVISFVRDSFINLSALHSASILISIITRNILVPGNTMSERSVPSNAKATHCRNEESTKNPVDCGGDQQGCTSRELSLMGKAQKALHDIQTSRLSLLFSSPFTTF